MDGAADAQVARPDGFVDGEEAAQVEVALELDPHALERNAECRGIGAIGDLLAGAERGQHQFDRIGAFVGAAEAGRLVDGDAMLAQRRLGMEALAQLRAAGKGRARLLRIRPKGALGFGDQGLQIAHLGLPLG